MAATTCSPSGPTSLPAELVLARLKPLLEDPAVLKIGHNLKFDWVVLDRRGISVAPYDDTLVMSFNLDAGGLNSHALDDLAEEASRPRLHRLQGAVRDRAEADHLRPGAARPGDRICRRGCRRDAAAVDALQAAAAVRERSTRVYEMVDRPMVAVVGADGARRGQGRPRGAASAVGRVQRPDRRARGARSAARPAASSPSAARSSSATSCSTRWASRAGARASRAPGRPTSPSSSGSPREGVPIAQLVLDWRQLTKLKIDLYRRAAGADQPGDRPGPHQLQPVGRADRAARLDRPQPAEHPDPHRDRPAHPRRLHRRAGPCHARRRLQPDRAAPRRAYGRRAAAARRRSPTARTSTT